MKSFNAVLRKARTEAGLTQMELAKLLGVSFCTVNRYENGRHAPKKVVKEKLVKLFEEKGIAFSFDDSKN